MTAKTPAYQLEYLAVGDPVRITREVMERNAKQIEAALLARAVPPAGATDITGVNARLNALEADSGWLSATLVAGWVGTVRYRRRGGLLYVRVDLERGTAGTGASQLITTLPGGFRPPIPATFPAYYGAPTYPVDIQPDGTVKAVAAGNTGLYGQLSAWPL